MRSLFILITTLVACISASPIIAVITPPAIHVRQDDYTENEFYEGGCRDVILFFARGSTQSGNIVCTRSTCIIL